MEKGDNYGCTTRKVIRQRCAPEEVEPGKNVYRCEKTIQTLRDCVGRPTEVIESQTEITEHELNKGWSPGVYISTEQGSQSFSSINWDKDFVGEIDNAFEGIERMTEGIMAGVERFTKEAERITGSLFGFPSFPGDERVERSRPIFSFPAKEEEREVVERDGYDMREREHEHEQEQESLYKDYADKVRDV